MQLQWISCGMDNFRKIPTPHQIYRYNRKGTQFWHFDIITHKLQHKQQKTIQHWSFTNSETTNAKCLYRYISCDQQHCESFGQRNNLKFECFQNENQYSHPLPHHSTNATRSYNLVMAQDALAQMTKPLVMSVKKLHRPPKSWERHPSKSKNMERQYRRWVFDFQYPTKHLQKMWLTLNFTGHEKRRRQGECS